VLVFAVPALVASAIASFLLFGAFAGALWLFALGDKSWPASVGNGLVILFTLVFLGMWVGLLAVSYWAGRRQESYPAWNPMHLALSAGATLLLLLLVVLHQLGVGNLGTPSNGALCSEFCLANGFAGSGLPPANSGARTCSCFDAQGHEARTVPIDSIGARRRQ